MGVETEIAWTDSTFNPWVGCQSVDPCCDHCYAQGLNKRMGQANWGPGAPRRVTSADNWKGPVKWNKAAEKAGVRRKVFCGSMCDWADKDAPRGVVPKLFDLIRATPSLDWLLLTKRANRIRGLLPEDWGQGYPNVWLGATVGDTKGLWRVDALGELPAAVRFVSMEPLLEPTLLGSRASKLDWVIVGGESGPKCRPMQIDWARALRDEAQAVGAAFFMKQIGGFPRKYDQMEDFPPDLQIRDFPTPRQVPALKPAGALL